jgi:hypothetical protein
MVEVIVPKTATPKMMYAIKYVRSLKHEQWKAAGMDEPCRTIQTHALHCRVGKPQLTQSGCLYDFARKGQYRQGEPVVCLGCRRAGQNRRCTENSFFFSEATIAATFDS